MILYLPLLLLPPCSNSNILNISSVSLPCELGPIKEFEGSVPNVSLLEKPMSVLFPAPPNKASKGLKILVSLRAVAFLPSFKNIWFRKEVSVPFDGKKDENGKSLNEEGEDEDWDSREENGEFEDWDGSIANGPNNCLNSERLKSSVEFFGKLRISASPEIELSLFISEFPMLKDELENGPPLQRFAKSSMPQMVCKFIGGIEFIMEVMFGIVPAEEFVNRLSSTVLGELFSSDVLNNFEELSTKLLEFSDDMIPCNIGNLSLSIANPVELVSSFSEFDKLSESILKE
jgi:hypothetical protein